jgi:ribose transport system permease protein
MAESIERSTPGGASASGGVGGTGAAGGASQPRRRRFDVARFAERWGVVVALVLLFTVSAIANDAFLRPENLVNILRQVSVIGVIAVGMTIVIIAGGIDLSVGSMVALIGVLAIEAMNAAMKSGTGEGAAVALAFGVALLSGPLLGLVNGALVAYGRVAAFIATLGAMLAYRSLALTFADGGQATSASREMFSTLGSGGVPIPGLHIDDAGNVPLRLPYSVLIFFAAACVGQVVLGMTRFGRHVYAVGCNERASFYAAINVRRVRLLTFVLLGACVGLGALLNASRMNSVSSGNAAVLMELDVIAAVVIGGTSMAGGRGWVIGSVLGAITLGLVNNALNMFGVHPNLHGLVKAVILIAAVLVQRAGR